MAYIMVKAIQLLIYSTSKDLKNFIKPKYKNDNSPVPALVSNCQLHINIIVLKALEFLSSLANTKFDSGCLPKKKRNFLVLQSERLHRNS